MKKIIIKSNNIILGGELNDSETAAKIWDALPIEGKTNTWGDEIYFSIPITLENEPEARADVEVGELGYWPPGRAFCLFFGPTPVSTGEQPRAASEVNVFGKIIGDARLLKNVRDGDTVTVERGE
ncbi:hypothetical protein JW935_01715 [candidate division KSB1 bacterium]|nr:hypothetical protein [candidate division KSB1 bacterium]